MIPIWVKIYSAALLNLIVFIIFIITLINISTFIYGGFSSPFFITAFSLGIIHFLYYLPSEFVIKQNIEEDEYKYRTLMHSTITVKLVFLYVNLIIFPGWLALAMELEYQLERIFKLKNKTRVRKLIFRKYYTLAYRSLAKFVRFITIDILANNKPPSIKTKVIDPTVMKKARNHYSITIEIDNDLNDNIILERDNFDVSDDCKSLFYKDTKNKFASHIPYHDLTLPTKDILHQVISELDIENEATCLFFIDDLFENRKTGEMEITKVYMIYDILSQLEEQ